MQALQSKYNALEAKAKEVGALDLLAIQEEIKNEQGRLAAIQTRISAGQTELESARAELQSIQQHILGAEDTVLLESFGLYMPT
jgi:chromosome segregation ATPase